MIYNFNMELQGDSRHWSKDQKNLFIVWDKPPFNVRLRPVRHPVDRLDQHVLDGPMFFYIYISYPMSVHSDLTDEKR